MYSIYISDTLEKLIDTVHKKQLETKNLFVGKLNDWYQWYLTKEGVQLYAINFHFYITKMRE